MKCLLAPALVSGLLGSFPCFADTPAMESTAPVRTLSPEDMEREQELDPYAQIKPAGPSQATVPPNEKTEVKGLFKDLGKLGSDIGKAGIKTLEGSKRLVGGADDLVKATDAVVKGAEVAPKKIVDGVEAAPKAVVKGTKNLVDEAVFPADANTMDYDGDI